ncbi:hypothetical protein QP794_28240 [Paenibacillus sp. UMB7766-LJ446]|uniref:hypothetical protein n=1 Tax=Paenibacillus sp. UMB7766-LJ446 TaxID=3046313 RepID=UPI00254BA84A|nr:hypothetical protein [Paenibacillus sp. UMB7766-LJ446]MDK8193977.1 hypothetical protein [Paenibacillus sp. UMB7766-LJ446]
MIDLTSGINLSSKEIELEVSQVTPQFIAYKDNKVEYATRFPNMMSTLWSYIILQQRVPSQKDFADYYIQVHSFELNGFCQKSVLARILRGYPSLVREIHFYCLANESRLFNHVGYSLSQDVRHGVDLDVGLGGIDYNVSCFVCTKRSRAFRHVKKTKRHAKVKNSIELPLNLSSGTQINGWVFFDKPHVDSLFWKIIDYAWLHYDQHPLDLIV